MTWRVLLASTALAIVLAGCDDSPSSSQKAPPPDAPPGRPLGTPSTDPHAAATRTALEFVRGYLAFQRGDLQPTDVPHAGRELVRGMQHQRIPPAARQRRAEVVRARVDRLDRQSARVTVTVRSVDEQLTYPLPLDLVRDGDRWTVLATSDDL